jgi:hypothetical protein
MIQKTETQKNDLSDLRSGLIDELACDILWFETAKKSGVIPLRALITTIASDALSPLKNTLGKIDKSTLIKVNNEHFEVFLILVRKAQQAIREGKLKVRHRVGLMDVSDTPSVIQWCNKDVSALTSIEEMFGPYHRLVVKVEDAKSWLSSMGTPLPDWFREFDSPLGSALESGSQWPWGDHNTKLLSHLHAAVERWWKLFDPNDQTTAPTNIMVADWLVKERGVAQRTAEAMATILRADGLPVGPRKK